MDIAGGVVGSLRAGCLMGIEWVMGWMGMVCMVSLCSCLMFGGGWVVGESWDEGMWNGEV